MAKDWNLGCLKQNGFRQQSDLDGVTVRKKLPEHLRHYFKFFTRQLEKRTMTRHRSNDLQFLRNEISRITDSNIEFLEPAVPVELSHPLLVESSDDEEEYTILNELENATCEPIILDDNCITPTVEGVNETIEQLETVTQLQEVTTPRATSLVQLSIVPRQPVRILPRPVIEPPRQSDFPVASSDELVVISDTIHANLVAKMDNNEFHSGKMCGICGLYSDENEGSEDPTLKCNGGTSTSRCRFVTYELRTRTASNARRRRARTLLDLRKRILQGRRQA
jgi:hypothetical protein